MKTMSPTLFITWLIFLSLPNSAKGILCVNCADDGKICTSQSIPCDATFCAISATFNASDAVTNIRRRCSTDEIGVQCTKANGFLNCTASCSDHNCNSVMFSNLQEFLLAYSGLKSIKCIICANDFVKDRAKCMTNLPPATECPGNQKYCSVSMTWDKNKKVVHVSRSCVAFLSESECRTDSSDNVVCERFCSTSGCNSVDPEHPFGVDNGSLKCTQCQSEDAKSKHCFSLFPEPETCKGDARQCGTLMEYNKTQATYVYRGCTSFEIETKCSSAEDKTVCQSGCASDGCNTAMPTPLPDDGNRRKCIRCTGNGSADFDCIHKFPSPQTCESGESHCGTIAAYEKNKTIVEVTRLCSAFEIDARCGTTGDLTVCQMGCSTDGCNADHQVSPDENDLTMCVQCNDFLERPCTDVDFRAEICPHNEEYCAVRVYFDAKGESNATVRDCSAFEIKPSCEPHEGGIVCQTGCESGGKCNSKDFGSVDDFVEPPTPEPKGIKCVQCSSWGSKNECVSDLPQPIQCPRELKYCSTTAIFDRVAEEMVSVSRECSSENHELNLCSNASDFILVCKKTCYEDGCNAHDPTHLMPTPQNNVTECVQCSSGKTNNDCISEIPPPQKCRNGEKYCGTILNSLGNTKIIHIVRKCFYVESNVCIIKEDDSMFCVKTCDGNGCNNEPFDTRRLTEGNSAISNTSNSVVFYFLFTSLVYIVTF